MKGNLILSEAGEHHFEFRIRSALDHLLKVEVV